MTQSQKRGCFIGRGIELRSAGKNKRLHKGNIKDVLISIPMMHQKRLRFDMREDSVVVMGCLTPSCKALGLIENVHNLTVGVLEQEA